MKENEKILRKLRKMEFNELLKDKDFLSQTIAFALKKDKEYIKKYIKLKNEKNNTYDLITKVTDTRIKIRIPKYNKIINNLKEKDNLYMLWYDPKNKEYKIKIYLDKIFEHCYKGIQKYEESKIKNHFKGKKLTQDEIINLSIIKSALMQCTDIKINIYSKI